ncbi:MAG: glycosyltransferase [Syntrophales bacterium LBB04]|nr:glycosyltransferase [Syntrophales bacterium LBB04]
MNAKNNPKISVITPSLNTAKYLRHTIDSILAQTFQNFEFIVVDGGSTDGTIEILKEYPQIRWISEKERDDDTVLEAYRKGLAMSSGDYIIQCCVSDGFLSKNWFALCNDKLDEDGEISVIWGLPQYMDEEGNLGRVTNQEFLKKAPPQKKDFFAYWLAFGYGFPEGNFCTRRQVFDECLPQRNESTLFSGSPHLTVLYRLNTRGYLPYFLPIIANFGRTHSDQRVERLADQLDRDGHLYIKMMKEYRKQVFQGRIRHCFRNGSAEIIGEIEKKDLGRLRRDIFRHYIKYKICKRLRETQESISP